MTPQELSGKFLQSYHLKTNCSAVDPIAPFLLMDITYSYFTNSISKIRCRHEMKKAQGEWKRRYTAFNLKLFRILDDDERDAACDLMDEFEEYIAHDLFIAEIQMMNCLIEQPLEHQKVISACLMSRAMCSMSRTVWRELCRSDGIDYLNLSHDLDGIQKEIATFVNGYYHEFCSEHSRDVDPNNDSNAGAAMTIIINKTISFIRKYHTDTDRNTTQS